MSEEILTINGIEYKFRVVFSYMEKAINQDEFMGVKLAVRVIQVKDNRIIPWKEIKDTHVGRKITEYIENCANGQRTFYWQWKETARI